jgi:hypothetical protein
VQHVDRALVRRRGPIRPWRDDRVEGVGDSEDPRPDRDLIAREAVGISGAVETLVVMANDRRQLGVPQARDERGAVGGMMLDDLELLRRQLSAAVTCFSSSAFRSA